MERTNWSVTHKHRASIEHEEARRVCIFALVLLFPLPGAVGQSALMLLIEARGILPTFGT